MFAAVLIAGVLTVVETMAIVTSAVLAKRGVLYEPEGIPGYASYLAERDPLLGWPTPGAVQLDASGARPAPDSDPSSDPGKRSCASLYGDSFTYGSHLEDDETYAHLLSQRFGCRIANFGIEGYGSDQALMRYRSHESERGSLVFLAHLSENALRNVNQYRALLYSTAKTAFKPRFIIGEAGELVAVPIPAIAPERYAEFIAAPEDFLEHEYFAPGGASGTNTRRFPHTLAVMRAFRHFHVRSQLAGEPWYKDFYRADHASNALQVTTGIFREFQNEALSRGQTPLALILPTELDLDYRAEQREQRNEVDWPHQPLVDALERENIPHFDTSNGFEQRLAGRAASEVFEGGHPTAEGHRILADVIGEHLASSELLPSGALTTP